jgi:hypothetical protein
MHCCKDRQFIVSLLVKSGSSAALAHRLAALGNPLGSQELSTSDYFV